MVQYLHFRILKFPLIKLQMRGGHMPRLRNLHRAFLAASSEMLVNGVQEIVHITTVFGKLEVSMNVEGLPMKTSLQYRDEDLAK